ncbi:right-handed parallel beta-helix repeat-containing protein [Methanobrevibacter ruminantium]|nr:right-handed parallel beta-helix repeat-containing protein [Methanobrevibacter ruminantium]
MKKSDFKRIFICLVLLTCLIGAVSAAEDVSVDDVSTDAVAVDTITEDASDPTDISTVSEPVSNDVQANTSQELNKEPATKSTNVLKDGTSTNIYVATTGSDENDGLTQSTAVASLAKAVEIVNATAGTDFTINVANGDYNISKIESPAAKNVNLIGESKEGAILHASDTYGINVYEDNIAWTIENLTICDFNSTTSTSAAVRCFAIDSVFNINNCIFKNIGSKNGAIYITSTGTRTISNVLIEDCFGTYSSSSSIIHLYGEGPVTLDNIEIRGSYMDPSVGTATYLRSVIYADQAQTNVTLKNSRIVDNIGAMGSLIEAKGAFKVINTTFEGNYLNTSSNGVNGGTFMFYSGTSSNSASNIDISQSVIKDNVLAGGSIGLFNCVYGTHNIDHNVIMNNKYANGNDVPLGSFSGAAISTDDNYWGTNERPNTKTTEWVILTVDTPEMAFVGVSEAIPVNLNTYKTTNNETGAVEGMPDVDFGVTYALNQANPSTVTVANGQGTINYLATVDGNETLTFSTGDAFSFDVKADIASLIYVDGLNGNATGPGDSEHPYKTIAQAINVAADGKIIVIKSGTYTENSLIIANNITLKADKNAEVIIDANNEGRIFTVQKDAIIRDLTLINGKSTGNGGAISLDSGLLTLNNVKIYNSTAQSGGAIVSLSGSQLSVSNSEFIDNNASNGGAIYVAGVADITNNKFISNDPEDGGAIYVAGVADIESNEFTSNHATNGGAIYIDSENNQTIKDNTFTSNTADKGEAIYIKNANVSLSGNTMGENDSIYLDGASLKTTLTFLGGKTIAAEFGQTLNLTATLTDEDGNNIRGGIVTFTANGETIATIDLSTDAQLKTQYTVPNDAAGDITISGSYSLDNGGAVISGKIHPAVPHWFIEGGSGYETLADAIDGASAGDIIYYDLPEDYTEVISSKTINKALTIKNNGTGVVTLDGNLDRILSISSASVNLENLIFINGATATNGGLIYLSGSASNDLNISGCTFKDSKFTTTSTYTYAVAIYANGGNINIKDSEFRNLTAPKTGMIYQSSSSGAITIENSLFDNITGAYDGGLINSNGDVSLVKTNVTNIFGSTSTSDYGLIYIRSYGGFLFISECQFINISNAGAHPVYYRGSGGYNITQSLFMNINSNKIIDASAKGYVNYNIFANNSNNYVLYGSSSSKISADYNFFGSNSKPTSYVSNVNYTYWTIVELSSASDTAYVGNPTDIAIQFVGTDGSENLTLEGIMPEYTFTLNVTNGTIVPNTVTLEDNEANAEFTPTSVGKVNITATPGPAQLTLNVIDPSILLVVSTDGSDTNPGTLNSPYKTIAHALTQANATRNVIYLLSSDDAYAEHGLTVSDNITIRAEDNTVTIDGGQEGPIFTVTGTLSIEDIILSNAKVDEDNGIGGAIYLNGGNLTVNGVVFSDCIAAYGGAIATTAGSNLTVINSVFSDNKAKYGGAIYVAGEANISNSEFSDNNNEITYGGAIYVNGTGPVVISANEFDNNKANKGEAIYIENGAVNVSENTIPANETIYLAGGSINSVLIFLANGTISAEFEEEVNLTATLTDDQGNAIKGGIVTFTANGETIATVDLSTDAQLETQYTVPNDATGDILISGSYSLDNGGVVATGIVHPAVPHWFIEGGSGYETLAEAVDAASAGDVIYGDAGTYDVSDLIINKAVTIKANESGSIVLNGNGNQIFNTRANVILDNLTFINGSASSNGGFIYVYSDSLVINNSVFKDLKATGGLGSAIYVATGSSNITIENSAFDNIKAATGLINCRSKTTTFTLVKTNFTNIDVSTNGLFYLYEGGLRAYESQFINVSGGDGAVVYFYGQSDNIVTKCLFDNVTTTKTTGIIYSNSKSANITYNAFLNVNYGVYSSSSYGEVITADYNYWGSNDKPGTSLVNSNSKLNNWVVMTVSPDTLDSLDSGATQAFTVDFTHYTDGTANYTMADTIPELTVSASAVKGSLDQSEVETQNNVATFTYTGSQNGEETVTFTNANLSIPVKFVVGEGYFGIVYVAKNGSDENKGSEDAPVATIARAVEIAQRGSGQIIITEGVYNENNITINSEIPISIKGQGDVVIDGEGLSSLSIFTIKSGEVSIEKISFRNNKAKFGAGVNVQGTSGSSLLDANVLINECNFDNLSSDASGSQGGAIYAKYLKGNLVINNSNFTNSIVKSGGGALTVAYCAYEDALDLVISNCNFENNTANNGGAAYLMANTINIVNTSFINNNATYSPGALELYNCTGTMDNCSFINNSAKNTAAAFKLEFVKDQPITSLIVTNSIFKDNVGRDEVAPAIFVDRASLNISNSILLNPLNINTSTVTGYGAVPGQGVTVANSNWWGTNENPSNLTAGSGDNVNTTIDNWVIMNVSPTEAIGYTGEALEITVDFKYTMSADGTIETLAGTLPEEFTVNANAANGTLDKTTADTSNLQAKFAFTPEFAGENIVNIYTTESNTVPVTIMVTEKYAGPIYVTKDGDDENEGSENLPVATIAKAIELAQGKSGLIFIGEGTYVESNLTISKDLNITALGEVIWDANGQRAFSMSTGSVSISNITFINGNYTRNGHLIYCAGDSLKFDECKFLSNGGNVTGTNGVIYVELASANFNNCYFENNTAGTGTSYGLISAKDSVIIVDGCTFVNNFNKNGCIYVSGSNIGSMAVINNTKFIGNNATSASGGSGGAIYASGSMAYQYSNGTVRPGAQSAVYVIDCDFINNTAFGGKYYNAEGGAIFVNANATLYASNSRFIDNTALDYEETNKSGRGGAIAATTGNVQISNCIFQGNTANNGSVIAMKFANKDLTTVNVLSISNSVIMGPGEKLIVSDFTNGSLVANNNWWAANENPSDRVSEGITVDSWVILTADPSEITGTLDEIIPIVANFRHTNSTDGTIGDLEGEFPELEVFGMTLDEGEITESNLTVDNVATLYYTPEETGETTVYAISGNAMVPIKVTITDTPQPVADVIYVSPSGADTNAGTYEAPVATIAHAVELAGAEGASGLVVIEEGIYNENGIVINSAIPITITGNGTVIIRGNNHVVNGNGAGRFGDVSESTSIIIVNTTEAVVIANIAFEDNIAANGGAILIAGTSSSNLFDADVLVENCSFNNLQGRNGGAIYAYYAIGNLTVANCEFTNINATWAALCAYQAAYGEGLTVEIKDSSFTNNSANNAPALYLQATNVVIKDSNFTDNNATYHPGAIYLQNTTATIDNCIVANNSAKYDKAAIAIHGGNIQYNPVIVKPSEVTITNSIIENNIGRDKAAPAIYLENSILNMSYSSVVNEININNTVTATYGDEKPGLVLINNNWWGTNDPSTTIFGTNITMDNWVIMNVEANATEILAGEEVKLTVDFNHVNTTAGEIEELTGGVIPRESYSVALSVDNGTVAPETLTIANGATGEAIFTAANANALITVTSENAVETILINVGEQPVPFTGVVYVSKDGDDANEGSEDEPVASLARAIEIATAEEGSGQIIIKEGTYIVDGYNITKDLTITGEGDVILDAQNQGNRLFNMAYGTTVSNFELHNLVLANVTAMYGAVVYSYAANAVLDNITVAGINHEMARLISNYGNLTIKDSVFANNTVSGIITHSGNNNLNIVNTIFEGNNVTYDSSIMGVVYVSSGRGNITIEDSKFYDNLVRQSTVRGYTDTNITVKGTEFINNTADNSPYYCSGGAIFAQANLDVTESIFINNNARREGGAIYIGINGVANITKSEFINNTIYDNEYYGDAIYTKGTTAINYCIFLTNGTRYAVYNGGSKEVNAQYNWWGTNDDPQGFAYSADASNWIIMTVTAPSTQDIQAGDEYELTVDFNHYTDGSDILELPDSLAQELTVEFTSTTGTFDNPVVTTENQVATAKYTVVAGENSITVKSTDAVWNTSFTAGEKAKAKMNVSMENNTIIVTLTDEEGAPIAGKTISVLINEDTLSNETNSSGIAAISLGTLDAGTYPATISLADSEYQAPELTVFVLVEETLVDNPIGAVIELALAENGTSIEVTLKDINGQPIGDTIVRYYIGSTDGALLPIDANGKGSFDIDNTVNQTIKVSYTKEGTEWSSYYDFIVNNEVTPVPVANNAKFDVIVREDSIDVFLYNDNLDDFEGAKIMVTIGEEDPVEYIAGENGNITIPINGDTTVELSYTDENGATVYHTVKVSTSGVDPSAEIEIIVESHNDTSIEVSVTVDGDDVSDGEITYYIGDDDDGTVVPIEDGIAIIPFDNTVNQTIEITYSDGDATESVYYTIVAFTHEVPVEPPVANGSFDVETTDDAIVATLVDSDGKPIADATVSAIVNGEEQNFTTDADGKLSVPIDGNATVELSYTDPENGAVLKYVTDVVTKEVPIEVPVVANGTMSVETTDDAVEATLVDSDGNPIENATVTAVIDGEEQNFTTDADGKVSIPVGENATVELSYTDPENGAVVKYSTKVVTKEVEVPVDVPVVANGTLTVETTDDAIVATLVDSDGKPIANATIIAVVDGEEMEIPTDEDGKCSVLITGNNTVEFSYTDPANNATVSYSTKVVTEVEEVIVPVPVVANATISLSTEDGSSIVATLKDLDGNAIANATLDANVNGEETKLTTDANGIATIPVSANTTAVVSYTDSNKATVTSSMSLTVIETIVEINKTIEVPPVRNASQIVCEDMNTIAVAKDDGRIGEYFYVKLVDANGNALVNKSVQIGFNGRVYNRTTNETGDVKLQINLAYKGTYTFAIAYLGDDNYNGSFVVSKITVKQQSPKITTTSKTYKASAKTKALTATFKTANGNLIADKTIKFTVNGKTYSGKTNAKGVATVKVSLNTKGTYSFTAKYAGDDTFKATSASGKLTIK